MVAILLAEPKWFLEDHHKGLAWKRKGKKKGKKNARPRTDACARTGDVSSPDSGSDSEGNTGNNIPNGDRERTSDVEVEEAIKSINFTAGGTGCKRTTDEVMRLFVNAHLLRGRKRCRRYHSNHYYKTADIRTLFMLDSSLRFP